MVQQALSYAGTAAKYRIKVDTSPEQMTICVPMQTAFDFWEFSVLGFFYLLRLLSAWQLSRRGTPRAVFEISGSEIRVQLFDPDGGRVRAISAPRADVVALRSNRYDKGIWLDIHGRTRETVLEDLPGALIDWLGATLEEAVAKYPPSARTEQREE